MLHMLSGTVSFTSVATRHLLPPCTTTPCDDHFGVKTIFRYRALPALYSHNLHSLLSFSLVTRRTSEYAQKFHGDPLPARTRRVSRDPGPCRITLFAYSRNNMHIFESCGPDMKLLVTLLLPKTRKSARDCQKQPETGQSGGECTKGGEDELQGEIVHSSRTSHSALRPALTPGGHPRSSTHTS